MNKTEYMNTLKEELEGLPKEVIEETILSYEKQFADGLAAGQSELDIAAKLPIPRLVAAQKRAGTQYKKFKHQMTPSNFAGFFFAFIGVMVFNFFMIIPAVIYAAALFAGYMTSFALYGGGIALMAASLSGVPHIQITLPGGHGHHTSENYRIERDVNFSFDDERHFKHAIGINIDQDAVNEVKQELDDNLHTHTNRHGNNEVIVDINEKGVQIKKNGKTLPYSSEDNAIEEELNDGFFKSKKYERHQHVVNIKNRLEKKQAFYGLGILLSGIGLFLFCLFMTKMTFVWFRQYLLWNLSLLRAPNNANNH